jgi:hypothetical protein
MTIFATTHDVIVYLTVLYIFVTSMLVGVRHISSRWATWHQKLTLVEDSELRQWYLNRVASECQAELQEKTDPAVLKLARQCLLRDVLQETRKPFFAKRTKDALVLRMAESYDSTAFLMVMPIFDPRTKLINILGLVLSLFWCFKTNDIQLSLERAN